MRSFRRENEKEFVLEIVCEKKLEVTMSVMEFLLVAGFGILSE